MTKSWVDFNTSPKPGDSQLIEKHTIMPGLDVGDLFLPIDVQEGCSIALQTAILKYDS